MSEPAAPTTSRPGHERESGDRLQFLGHLRRRLVGGVPVNTAHPLPPPLDAVPVVIPSTLDPDDPVGSFVRNAERLHVVVHVVDAATVPDALVADVVARHGVRTAVVTAEPDAQALVPALTVAGVECRALAVSAASHADLGVTSVTAAIAATGSLVVESAAAGGRTGSLLPPRHLAVVPASRLRATTADVLRGLGNRADLPSNLVLITGPSRSGDIEQILALGVHGPVAVEVVLLLDA